MLSLSSLASTQHRDQCTIVLQVPRDCPAVWHLEGLPKENNCPRASPGCGSAVKLINWEIRTVRDSGTRAKRPFVSTRMNTLTPSFKGTACLQPVAFYQSKEKAKRIYPRQQQEGVLLLTRIQTLASETGICGILHLPSRQSTRPFSSHLERFLVGFMSEVLKGWWASSHGSSLHILLALISLYS